MAEALSFEELTSAAKPEEPVAPPVTPTETVETKVEDDKPQFTSADVAAYQQLSEMGITPGNASEFLQAKTALQNLGTLLEQDPKQFMRVIQQANPQLAGKALKEFSDLWYEQYLRDNPDAATTSASSAGKSTPMADPRIDALASEVERLKSERQQEVSARHQAENLVQYEKAFDELVAKLPEGVPDDKREYIRLKAEKALWKDPAAQKRISQGIYIDVPKFFADASRRVTAETKTATEIEAAKREKVADKAGKTITPGVENPNGQSANPQSKDIWEVSPQELAAAYKR